MSNIGMADCAPTPGKIFAEAVDSPWQKRLRRAGLSQVELARLAGARENTISEGLRGKGKNGVPVYLKTIIRFWEKADGKVREAILEAPDVEAED